MFFEKSQLSKIRQDIPKPLKNLTARNNRFVMLSVDWLLDYSSGGTKRFRAWLHYNQYRKHLILNRIHKYIVKTDITNYFESILFCRVRDILHEIVSPPGMVDLLFLLLERFGHRPGLRESPHIGLPIDEADCSRKLAHIFL